MARVANPLSSEAARGKMGPVLVFSAWRGLSTVRSRVRPSNPRTTRQLEVRSIVASLAAGYGGLTTQQALAWRDYARSNPRTDTLGQQYYASGINAFTQINFFLTDMGFAGVSFPPGLPFKGNVTGFTATKGVTDGLVELAFTPPSGAVSGDRIEIQVSRLMPNAVRQPQQSDFRHWAYTAGDATSYNVTGLSINGWYWFRVRFIQATGVAGLFLSDQAQGGEEV